MGGRADCARFFAGPPRTSAALAGAAAKAMIGPDFGLAKGMAQPCPRPAHCRTACRKPSVSVWNFGAGDEIRTHDPNPGKREIARCRTGPVEHKTERNGTKLMILSGQSAQSLLADWRH
jgi:hypothetical protein